MKIVDWDGKPISVPGIYRGVPIEVYHGGRLCAGPSISSSGLRTIFMKSEAHFYDTWPLNPNCAPKKSTSYFDLGRAVHHALLGEALFSKTFVTRPERIFDPKEGKDVPWNGNRTVCREWLAEAKKIGKTVLTEADLADILGMAVALGKEPLVRQGVLNGHIECTMAWIDQQTGVWCLARPDVIPTDSGDFVDPKTSSSVVYIDLVRSIAGFGYHQQGAFVGEGFEALTKQKMLSFCLYFIESSRPYCTCMVKLSDRDLGLGRQQNRNALWRFVNAINSGQWPGPGGLQDAIQDIEISDRARLMFEGKLKFEGVR